jgi:hypothetical protein
MTGGDRKGKGRYAYALSTHGVEDVRAQMKKMELGESAAETPVMYCDDDGVCMFDEERGGYTRALEALLNAEAARGRRLVQVLFREKQMIAIWEMRREE